MKRMYLGNHFTVPDDQIPHLANLMVDMNLKDVILLDQPLGVVVGQSAVVLLNEHLPGYRIKFKFGSSFDNQWGATSLEHRGLMLYRSILIDILIYSMKLLADRQIQLQVAIIPHDDIETLEAISDGLALGPGLPTFKPMPQKQGVTFDSLFTEHSESIGSHQLHIVYWLAYIKIHYPIEFCAALAFLSSCYLPGFLEVAKELESLICSSSQRDRLERPLIKGNGFLYPGSSILFRKHPK